MTASKDSEGCPPRAKCTQQMKSRRKSVLQPEVFQQLGRIRKPMRNTQHKAFPIAHSPFYKPCERLHGTIWWSVTRDHWCHTLSASFLPDNLRPGIGFQFVCSIRLRRPPGHSNTLGEADWAQQKQTAQGHSSLLITLPAVLGTTRVALVI